MVELLAPAGSMEALKAAVENGADSVYLGGKAFSARANAVNFDRAQLIEAVDYCHIRGVKLYVTVNTLIREEELEELAQYLQFLHRIGVDALIIQDLAVVRLARELTTIPLHGSTQMTIHNRHDLQVLEELGLSRVVLARELSLEEVRTLGSVSSLELEIFLHGALCVAYSGQCLFSSLLGGRSGNRGECAQPCRLRYRLVAPGQNLSGYLLSMRDLCLLDLLGDIVTSKVAALKIEGRMKAPEYVATVTRVYRAALDRALTDPVGFKALQQERDWLEAAFTRGFTSGYLGGRRGKEVVNPLYPGNRGVYQGEVVQVAPNRVWVRLARELEEGEQVQFWSKHRFQQSIVRDLKEGKRSLPKAAAGQVVHWRHSGRVKVGDEVYKLVTDLAAVQSYTSSRCLRRVPVKMHATVAVGQPLTLELEDGEGNRVQERTSLVAEAAKNHPLTEEVLLEKLLQLGDVPFQVVESSVKIDGEPILPFGELKQVRRAAFERLMALRAEQFRRPPLRGTTDLAFSLPPQKNPPAPLRLGVLVNKLEFIEPLIAAGADRIYFGGEAFTEGREGSAVLPGDIYWQALERVEGSSCELFWAFPRITKDRELGDIAAIVGDAPHLPSGLLVANLGTFQLLRGRAPLWADFSFNIYNPLALVQLYELGFSGVCLSCELSLNQLPSLGQGPVPTEVIVQGRLPVMVSEYCPGRLMDCQPCLASGTGSLVDRLNLSFPIRTDGACRMHLFNSRELAALRTIPRLREAGVELVRLDLRLHSLPLAKRIVELYRQALAADTRGLKEIEGELLGLFQGEYTLGHFYQKGKHNA